MLKRANQRVIEHYIVGEQKLHEKKEKMKFFIVLYILLCGLLRLPGH